MNRFFRISILGIFIWLTFASCSKEYKKYTQWSRKGTISQKDSAAFFFYNQEEYDKASYLFEELRATYRGSERAKTVLYHYAYSKYHSGFYILGSHYFEQYTQLYPNDELTPECTFMIGYCYYLESDPYYLDQNYTKKAINQFQLFINSYPFSDKVDQCNELMSTLRERLARKDLETAKLYFNTEKYRAAVTSFSVFMQGYPDSRYREEAHYMLVSSAYNLAEMSIRSKKKNRYLDAIDWYEEFIDKYPNSVYKKEAENIYAKAKKGLGKLLAAENES
jgi:outer membrane protein assembly factor BamD